MIWLFAIVIILLVVFSSRFRKVALVAVALLVGAFGLIYQNRQESEQRYQESTQRAQELNYQNFLKLRQRDQESRQRAMELIPVTELDFQNVMLQDQTIMGIRTFTGRIKNNSQNYTLTNVGLHIILEECESYSPRSNCTTIGENTRSISVLIPPGQLRGFSVYVKFEGTRPEWKSTWHYTVSYTEGK